MKNDGVNTLTYDGEARAVAASGSLGSGTYTVDGNGLRVKKVAGSTTTVYIFSGSKVIAEYQNGAAPSAPTTEYVYAGGTLIAKINSSGTNYYHQDHLSNRLVTNSSGGAVEQLGHFPFGESWYNATSDKLMFTTYERDSESGNDYAMARYHVSRLGRLSSPDPLSGSTSNPQSLNRYSYSLNDPAILTDPSGALTGCHTAQETLPDKSQTASGHGTDDSDSDYSNAEGQVKQSGCDIPPSDDPFGMDSSIWPDGEGNGWGPPPLGQFSPGGWQGEFEQDIANGCMFTDDDFVCPIGGQGANGLDGGGGGPLCGIINCGRPNPPPPPGYEDCMKGLAVANKNFGAVQRALDNWGMLQAVGGLYGVNPSLLGAIGIRETGFQNVIQPGPMKGNKTGFGTFQVTNGSVPWTSSMNPMWGASYAANLLTSNMNTLQNKFPNFTPTQLLQATAASYNFGKGNISGNPATIDWGTAPGGANGNYGSDILLLMNCF